MNSIGQNADRWLVTSAVVVGGTYAVLKWKGLTQTTVPTFTTAWGCVFLVLALMTEASPQFGGSFSLLVMTGDLLANGQKLAGLANTTAAKKNMPVTGTTGASAQAAGNVAKINAVTTGDL